MQPNWPILYIWYRFYDRDGSYSGVLAVPERNELGSLSLTATGSSSGEHVTRAERVTHA